ncbi:endomembrane protein 70 [Plectosphaerella plurivora]|uniref:Transmembrane 9 superfamily member n=1 Tax=Plectosphaerella plurivora TaxID=936078 RepID=A0A9P9A6Z1_9PEZI|nr:endomembrane protein 70 [Plectosphaerella plurivora]
MRGTMRSSLGCALLAAAILPVDGFFIPGWSTKSYHDNEPIPLLVNKIWSDKTQLQFAYYDLPFVCPPTGLRKPGSGLLSGQNIPLNLGEVLRGDRIAISDFDLAMGVDQNCTLLCERKVMRRDLTWTRALIGDSYVAEWIVDNLPGATSYVTMDKKRKYYSAGFKLGRVEKGPREAGGTLRYLLYNHHTIMIRWRRAPGPAGDRGEKVIVGFEVYPKSITAGAGRTTNGCPVDVKKPSEPFELELPWRRTTRHPSSTGPTNPADELVTIPYTYSVFFREDESVEYADRWDLYYVNEEQGGPIHWIGIINSLIVCGMLTAVVSTLLTRSVRADMRSRREALLESGPRLMEKLPVVVGEAEVETGDISGMTNSPRSSTETLGGLEDLTATDWKLLRADIFHPPKNGHLLAPLVGSGTQLLFMVLGLVSLGSMGVFGPSFRGGIVSVGIGLFVFAGLFSGYFSARVYRVLDAGPDYRRNALLTATLFPGMLFGTFFTLNLFVWAQASSTAIPFGTLLALVTLWLGVQVPLVYAGSFYGFHRSNAWENPSKPYKFTSPEKPSPQVPTLSPKTRRQPWYFAPIRALLLSGFVPFSVIVLELLSIFHSLYNNSGSVPYHTHRQLFFTSPSLSSALVPMITLLLLLATVSQTAIVSVHLHLCGPSTTASSQWWWRGFLSGASPAVWVFGYAAWYFHARLPFLGPVSVILYFGNALMASAVFGLLTGTVGFLSTYAFVRRIYG